MMGSDEHRHAEGMIVELPEDPEDVVPSAASLGGFVDRVPESVALAESLARHRHRIDTDGIDIAHLRHVLVFYGDGGVGKTELSRQLSHWVTGHPDAPAGWGPKPATRVDAVARWELSRSHGDVDPVDLLLELRRACGRYQRVWPAFDLAFTAYLRALRPGQNLTLTEQRGTPSLSVADVLTALVSDAAAIGDIALSGGLGTTTVGVGRTLLAMARHARAARNTLAQFGELADLIAACDALPSSDEQASRVAGRLVYLLSREVARIPAKSRPLVLVFVDPLERLQIEGRRPGEATLNRLVAALPLCLFVMTGRGSLRWHEPDQTHLDRVGAARWPNLVLGDGGDDEPRQHRVGNLSEDDARDFLTRALTEGNVPVAEGLAADLARQTDGWPLHLTTIVEVAIDRAALGRPLTMADLGGPLPELVNRVFEDLPSDEADALRAGCLLPYFDPLFAARAGGVTVGAVERLAKRGIVQHPPGALYPHRIHDEIRRIVREAGSAADGGWAEQDWLDHADLALAEAHTRYERAIEVTDDRRAILALALALNVGAENGVYAEWLLVALRQSPTLKGLAPLLTTRRQATSHPDITALIRFVEIMGQPRTLERSTALDELTRGGSVVASTAGLWNAYDLRSLGKIDEAVAQLDALALDPADRVDLYRVQAPITYVQGHRHADALERARSLAQGPQRRVVSAVDFHHGRIDGRAEFLAERIRDFKGRRYVIEQHGDWLVAKHLEMGVSIQEIEAVRTESDVGGHGDAQCQVRRVDLETHLYDDARAERLLEEMEDINATHPRPYAAWLMALAMRGWATGNSSYLHRASELATVAPYHGGHGWVQVEFLMEYLGHPIRCEPTQWLEPREVVRDRWLAHFQRVKARALARATQA